MEAISKTDLTQKLAALYDNDYLAAQRAEELRSKASVKSEHEITINMVVNGHLLQECPRVGDFVKVRIKFLLEEKLVVTGICKAVVLEELPGNWSWSYQGAIAEDQKFRWKVETTGELVGISYQI